MIRWMKRLRRRGEPTPGQQAAGAALDRARSARQEAEERRPAVQAAAAKLRHAREENHFAARIRAALEGGS